MVSSSHLRRMLMPQRSNLFKSHWSNQWLTFCAVKIVTARSGEIEFAVEKSRPYTCLIRSVRIVQRKPLRHPLSPICAAPGTQSNDRSDCPSSLPLDLEDSAPGSSLRRTGPSG